ncbi:helix-hairpin-helix domain-containing protein [Zobellia amurskyensis]|uniref:Helix-hairpin-helix domain-containing protein n=1 Tax=Zobellia amurskyensis TaxID=248905 RepID=A0A7X2ZXJ5_9FLAO|nr:helix-hairpin-helix domain-containing protein [Zobellia amurskyensis]MUH38159.1 helix-hairpin-helix domain-containing protein [Zobellia amurskyensis]
MKDFKSHFRFNKQERSGVFYLLFIIVTLQVAYFVLRSSNLQQTDNSFLEDGQLQAQIDSLKARAQRKDSVKIYPFNPNYITDYKGYALGLSVEEIDRLHVFRKQGKFANTVEDFQKVTLVSDSLLQIISPYFKFPEWTQKKTKSKLPYKSSYKEIEQTSEQSKSNYTIIDLNSVTAEQLQKVNGIGEKLSARIVKFRDRLGGFLVSEQLYDVYGLEPEVVERTLKQFQVIKKPVIQKININTASAKNLSKLVYLQKHVSESIVNYRSNNGIILSFDELSKIEDFPFEKIDRIKLYLTL